MLNITQPDVPYLQLHYVARKLVDGMRSRTGPSITKVDGTEDDATNRVCCWLVCPGLGWDIWIKHMHTDMSQS